MSDHEWLPDRLVQTEFDDWKKYFDHVYGVFVRDFIDSPPFFNGRRVLVDSRRGKDGRVDYFWHLVSRDPKGGGSRDDNFDGARCERIRWIRAIIENAADPSRVLRWSEGRGRHEKWSLALPDFSYVVVLRSGGPTYFILTAFPPDTWTRYPDKLREKYEEYLRSKKS